MVFALVVIDQSFKREFYRYASKQVIRNLERVEREVVEHFDLHRNFRAFRKHPDEWERLKFDAFDFRFSQSRGQSEEGLRPHRKPLPHYDRFIDDIVLVDTNKTPIAGRFNNKRTYIWRPVERNQRVIAYVGYIKPKRLIRRVDELFIKQHGKRLAWACLIAMVFSVFVAAWISRRIAIPIRRLSEHTDRLASGDYSVKVPVNSLDEIGDLCRHFNELALTLNTQQNARSQWVADISHEMRTPVSVMKAQIESMLDGVRPLDTEQLQIVAAKVENLRKLVDDLFELSLADMGSMTYRKEAVVIVELLEDVARAYQPKLEQKHLALKIQIELPQDTIIYGDIKRLTQLFQNIFENSYRYTDAGGQLLLHVSATDEHTRVVLSDTAPTVAVDKLEKIFERLYRTEASRSRETGGAGLGLAICKNIVEAHAGRIWAEPSPMGGVSIVILLPRWLQRG